MREGREDVGEGVVLIAAKTEERDEEDQGEGRVHGLAGARGAGPCRSEEGDEDRQRKEGNAHAEANHVFDEAAQAAAGDGAFDELLRHGVGLVLEPADAEQDEADAKGPHGEGLEQGEAAAEEPDGAGDDDEEAEPRGLADGAAKDVGEGGDGDPVKGGVVCGGLQGADAEVDTEEERGEAGHIRHEAEAEREEEGGEDEGEGSEGGVALCDAAADEGAVHEEGGDGGDEEDGGAGYGEGEAENFDENCAEDKLPSEDGAGPAEVVDPACLGHGLGGADVGPVVIYAHFHERTGDYDAKDEGGGAEQGVSQAWSHGVYDRRLPCDRGPEGTAFVGVIGVQDAVR